jgi:dihydroorotate dehydrogenase
MFLPLVGLGYRRLVKPLLFQFDPEDVHVATTHLGELLGNLAVLPSGKNSGLEQTIAGIKFPSPIGLAAGFDYEARLTQILPALGFGFETIGTITNAPYDGNPKPRLGRLPEAGAIVVNKGFKNLGAKATIAKLTGLPFKIPVGISIGRTNSPKLATQKQSIDDILRTFRQFEDSKVAHSYYELNISCPNLVGNISFYPPKNLRELLLEVDHLRLKRPVFVKMPITKTDDEVLEMLAVINKFSPQGVIFGNLHKSPQGNLSGKPTFTRSNQLIKLAHDHFSKRLVIIGCGGVFNAADAIQKLSLGASLVQLITGLVYEGPQLVAQINRELTNLTFPRRTGS